MAQTAIETATHEQPPVAARILAPRRGIFVIAGALFALIGALVFPPAAFSVDEAIYIDMAHAMATRGALDVTPQNLPDGAPLMAKSHGLVQVIGDRAVPQYPGPYGVIAAPFFVIGGVKGLIFLNALCGVFCLWLTHAVARTLTNDPWVARMSVFILGGASIFAGYVFAIWPHMLALAFVLAGAYASLLAGRAKDHASLMFATGAGLIFGLGVGIRVDVILAAIAALFWMRLFAKPSARHVSLALAAGLAPGLLLAAWINQIKFGVFNPFSYGAEVGSISIGHHVKTIVAITVVGAFAMVVDVSSKPAKTVIGAIRRAPAPVIGGGLVAVLAAVWFVFPSLFKGAWLMLVDIQAYAGAPRPGLERDAYGYWDFWGVPKKALFQSMPWIGLALAPIVLFFRGRKTNETAFALLFALAVILFFSMRGWHGGMAYNMRYYLGAAPFIAILAAIGLSELRPVFDKHKNLLLRGAIAGVALAIGAYALSPLYGGVATPMRLYPQLVLAALLAVVVLTMVWRPENQRAKIVGAILAGAALANGAMISVFDINGYFADRARYVPYDRAYGELITPDAVIFTQFDELLISASLSGAAVIRLTDDGMADTARMITAYAKAGRCIYAHTFPAAQTLGLERFEALPMPADAPAPGLALYVYRDAPARCR